MMMNDEIEITVYVNVGLVGCAKEETFTMSRQDWEGMDESEQEEICKEVMFDMIEWYYEVES